MSNKEFRNLPSQCPECFDNELLSCSTCGTVKNKIIIIYRSIIHKLKKFFKELKEG